MTGRQAESALLDAGVDTNRNSVPADPNGAWYTSGIRLGTPALTTRGFGHDEFDRTAELIVQVLQKMVKQRRDSIATYEQGNRKDLADKEAAEITVIEEYLPSMMDETATRAAIAALIAEVGAAGPKDMGKVMGALKTKFAGQIDFGKASGLVKELLK